MTRLRVGIIGSGNIGTDLLVKVLRSEHLECVILMGRNLGSAGMVKARTLGVPITDAGVGFLEQEPDACDLVFDATSASDHIAHAEILRKIQIPVVDLTPAALGPFCVPAVNLDAALGHENVNMVTCGGQASAPIVHALGRTQSDIDYIEVISTIASRSAGPATRANLDEYIHATERAIRQFSGARRAKAVLNINPAEPCIDMQTTVFAKVGASDLAALEEVLENVIVAVQSYVPGYELLVGPIVEHGRIAVMVRVRGLGDHLPAYAGNLDIINCAGIAVAEELAKRATTEGVAACGAC